MSDYEAFKKFEKIEELHNKAKEIAISFGAEVEVFKEVDEKLTEFKKPLYEKIQGGIIMSPKLHLHHYETPAWVKELSEDELKEYCKKVSETIIKIQKQSSINHFKNENN